MMMFLSSFATFQRRRLFRAATQILAGLVILSATGGSARAQTTEPIDTVRVDTDLVNLNVSLFGVNVSQRAPALEQKDFTVFENGVRQEISFFASAQTPFDLVLLLDLSGSTADKIDLIRKSSKHFVAASRPNDRIAIATFTTDVRVVSLLTLDHQALAKKIDQIEKPRGGTNFWDALRFCLEHILSQSRAENRRSAVVVMSDGVDNALPDVAGDGSTTTFSELLGIVRNSDTVVLPVYLDTEVETLKQRRATPRTFELARESLTELAAASGNQLYRARKVKDLNGVYEQVMRDLATVYSIGYRPINRERDGTWRSVTVRLIDRPEVGIRAKAGYYAK